MSSSAPAFVLIHGLSSNLRLWDGVRDALVASGARVVAMDLRGHGPRSPKPDAGYDVPTVAGDVAALVERLGLERPVVAGQSWGGHVALELAASWPSLVGALALIDGGWMDLSQLGSWESTVERLAPPRSEGMPVEELVARLPGFARDAMLASFEIRDDGTVAPWLTYERHLLVLRGMWEHRPPSLYERVHVPVLLVPCDDGGERGALWREPKRDAICVAEKSLAHAGVRTHWFAAAHDVHAQHPREVAALLLELSEQACVPSS